MAKAIFFGATEAQFCEAQDTRSLRVMADFLTNIPGISRFAELGDVEFLFLCVNGSPQWLVKVHEFVLVPGQRSEVLIRLSAIKNVWEVPRPRNSHFSGSGSLQEVQAEYLASDKVVEFSVNLEVPSSLSLSEAAKLLADTYCVDVSQVKITISN